MKPFFTPFFGAAMATRFGRIIGKSNERKMMDKAGGPNGTSKVFRQNPDGSTAMLKTKMGMPQFTTPLVASSSITVSNESTVMLGGPNLIHTITLPGSSGGTYTLTFVDGASSFGLYYGAFLTDSQFSAGVTISSGPTTDSGSTTTTTLTVLVPGGVSSFTVEIEISGGAYNDYSTNNYTLTVSSGSASGVGSGTVLGWCNVNYVSVEEDPEGYHAWASRCI